MGEEGILDSDDEFLPDWYFEPELYSNEVYYSDSDDEYDMTDEERAKYSDQLRQSDGFYVEAICEGGMIVPLDLSIAENMDMCILCSKLAIDEFNSSEHKDIEGKLEFVKIVMAISRPRTYHLTFDAKHLDKEGHINTYQAEVYTRIERYEVSSFRLKPSTNVQEKKWFWETRL